MSNMAVPVIARSAAHRVVASQGMSGWLQDNQQIVAPSGEIRGSATKLDPAARMETRPSDTLTATSSCTGSRPGTGRSRTQTRN